MKLIERISESKTVWQRLSETQKPIYIYGMGDGALKIMAAFEQHRIPLAGFFASDEFVRGHSFMGHKVHTLAQVESIHGDVFVVLAFGVRDQPTIDRIVKLSKRHELVAPDLPVAGEGLFDLSFMQQHIQELEQVYSLLADELSRQAFCSVINYKISGKIEYLLSCETTVDEAYSNILHLGSTEHYADLGAYRGDTVREFLHYTEGRYSSITALEPDRKNFAKLAKSTEALENVRCLNIAAHSTEGELYFATKGGRHSALDSKSGKPIPANSLDNLLAGEPVTFINMDVEGAEGDAIAGCAESIKRYRPKLLIAAYHRTRDIFALPLQVMDIYGNYNLYMRHYKYLPAWDVNFYFTPKSE